MATRPRTGYRQVQRGQRGRPYVPAGQSKVNPSLAYVNSGGWVKCHREGRCRMCQRPAEVRPLTRHHLVPQSWFDKKKDSIRLLRNADSNVIPLCRPCHDLVDNSTRSVEKEARRELRRCLGTAEIAFLIQLRGKSWLEQEYPSGLPIRCETAADLDRLHGIG